VTGTSYENCTFRVRRQVLAQLADQALPAVPASGSLAVYECFRVTVQPGLLQLAGTDSQLTVLASTRAVVTEDTAQVFVPARRLKAILAEAPEGDVEVSVSGNTAKVTAGKPHWELRLPPPRNYPELVDPEAVTFAKVSRAALLDALRAVRHAASKDASRPQFAQVRIGKDGEDMFAVAHDGSQTCRAPVPGFPFETTVPTAMLDHLVKLLTGTKDDEVEVGEEGSSLAVRAAYTVLACQQVTAPFPKVDSLVLEPTAGYPAQLSADRDELAAAVRRVAISAQETTSAMGLVAEAGTLTVVARDDDGNRAEEVIAAGWPGGRRVITVNHRHLAAMLRIHPAAACSFRLGEDQGRRRSMLRLDHESGGLSVIPQLPPSAVGL